jgi:uncharacterized protein
VVVLELTPCRVGGSVALRGLGILLAALTTLAALLLTTAASALEVPPLEGRVNDRAKLLSPRTERRLTATLQAYENKTGHQLAILTVPTLEGDPIEDFGIRVVEAWKLGRKGQDDGILLLVAARDKKMRIEVGYGLEGDLTDLEAGRIVRDIMAPLFRQGDFDGGILAAVGAILAQTGAEGLVPEQATQPQRRRGHRRAGGSLPVILFVLTMLLVPMFGRRRWRRGGGIVFFGGGFGGGGYRGGGGFGGGGFGGGGFGGGGGGFGGGGASGGW